MPRRLRAAADRRAAAALPAPALLQLMWLASPALPVGGFSYSEGLETAVDQGLVSDEPAAARWLVDQLRLGLQRADLPLLASAFKAWQRSDAAGLVALNDWALQTRETFEMRQQTEQMGRSLADWLRQRYPGDARLPLLALLQPSPTWPLAFALAAAISGAPLRESLLAFGFGWAENMVQAAIKSVPLGQSAGQRLLGALADALPAAVDAAIATAAAGGGERQNLSPMLAILSARHEAQYSRLFRS
jgi:urease accessory protein